MIPQNPDEEEEFSLRHYLHVATRRKWTIALATVVGGALALGVSLLQPKIYEAEARLVLQPDQAESIFGSQSEQGTAERTLATEIQIIKSRPVETAAGQKIRSNDFGVRAGPVGDTDVIRVTGSSEDPAVAAQVANAYANAYVEFKRQSAVEALLSAATEINKQIATIQAEADGLDAQIGTSATSPANAEIRIRRDSLISQIGAFRQQLDQVQVQARLKNGNAQIVSPAVVPDRPSSPKPRRTTATGLGLGFILGIGLAFLREQLDESIRSKDDVEQLAGGLAILAIIPSVPQWREREKPMVVALDDPTSHATEAYRSLRTSVQFMGLDHKIGLIQMTSPSASEGKTTTLTNLAVVLAGAGLRVTVVCCDLRRPRVHEFFGLNNEIGFTSVLLGMVPLKDALQDVPGVPRLRLLASGPPPPNPSELLSHPRSGELLRVLGADADVVLIDSPPVLPVTDASVLSRWADATVVVVSADQTSRRAAERALELLRQVDAPLVGLVLNGVSDSGGAYGYGYGYGYGYQHYADDSKPSKKKTKGDRSHRKRRSRSDFNFDEPFNLVDPSPPVSATNGAPSESEAESQSFGREIH